MIQPTGIPDVHRMQSLYNTPHYNMDLVITLSSRGSQIFYHGIQGSYRQA